MGQVTHVAVHLGEIRRREVRRMLVLSAASHLVLLGLLFVKPSYPVVSMPGVVSVELVAAPAPASPPRVVALPKPVPKKVVLPEKPTTPKPKPEEVEEKVPPPEPERVEQDYNDVLAQLRADAGERASEPSPPTPAAGIGSGVGRPISPEVAAWVKKAKIHVRRSWVLPPAFRTQALEAHVLVDLDAGGNVIGMPDVVRRSGNPWYDEGVVRAIQKASPLPPPPAADEWAFVFVPGDSY